MILIAVSGIENLWELLDWLAAAICSASSNVLETCREVGFDGMTADFAGITGGAGGDGVEPVLGGACDSLWAPVVECWMVGGDCSDERVENGVQIVGLDVLGLFYMGMDLAVGNLPTLHQR